MKHLTSAAITRHHLGLFGLYFARDIARDKPDFAKLLTLLLYRIWLSRRNGTERERYYNLARFLVGRFNSGESVDFDLLTPRDLHSLTDDQLFLRQVVAVRRCCEGNPRPRDRRRAGGQYGQQPRRNRRGRGWRRW